LNLEVLTHNGVRMLFRSLRGLPSDFQVSAPSRNVALAWKMVPAVSET
jgi:hypothetical protein